MNIKNEAIAGCMAACNKHLGDRGVLGYACARNLRMLAFSASEYLDERNSLIKEYGRKIESADGVRYEITPSDESWNDFEAAISPLNGIEHDIDVTVVNASDLIGAMSGSDLLELDFMLNWGIDEH